MKKNPVDGYMDNSLAAVFTMMLPGLGQMLKSQVIPGLIWAALVGGGYLINGWLGLSVHVCCILDAALVGGKIPARKFVGALGLSALIIYTCLRTALF